MKNKSQVPPGTVLKSLLKVIRIFPAHNLNFHWRWWWWNQIEAIFLILFYFTGFLWVFIILEGYIDFVPTTYSVLASQCIENEAYNNSYIYVLQKLCSSSQLLLVFSRVFCINNQEQGNELKGFDNKTFCSKSNKKTQRNMKLFSGK